MIILQQFKIQCIPTLIVCEKSLETSCCIRNGSGSVATCLSPPCSRLYTWRLQSNCNEAMRIDTHAMWTTQPVATNSLLSLWPHVNAVTGNCTEYTIVVTADDSSCTKINTLSLFLPSSLSHVHVLVRAHTQDVFYPHGFFPNPQS